MKRCPQCNRTYADDALSFCLDDGSPLVSAAAPSSFDPSATVQYPQSRETTPPPTIAYPGQSAPPPPQSPAPPPAWSPMPPPAPQKRSVWPWLLGIGAVLVFIVIGIVILIIAIAKITNDNNNNRVANTNTNRTANRNTNTNRNTNDNTNANENSNTRSSLTSFTDDFSTPSWGVGPSQYGRIWYDNEEYHMRATKGGYIVMYSPADRKEYQTENATVRVGLRSIDGDVSSTGYGLLIHGLKAKDGNLEDYGFLISNGDNPKYRIVLHKAGKETTLVEPTTSSTIRTGTTPNQVEVRI